MVTKAQDNLDAYKSWIKSFPVGQTIYKGNLPYLVLSAGIDFLILKSPKDTKTIRVMRNTEESLAYSPTPPLDA
jgi:hypothetical protein